MACEYFNRTTGQCAATEGGVIPTESEQDIFCTSGLESGCRVYQLRVTGDKAVPEPEYYAIFAVEEA